MLIQPNPVSEDKLDKLSSLAQKQRNLEERKSILAEELKELEKNIEQVSRFEIPEILNEVGLSEIKLKTGEKIIVKDELKANINKDNKNQAFLDMIQSEVNENMSEDLAKAIVSDMFKTTLFIKVNTESEKENVANQLIGLGIPFTFDRDIHWQTLRKWCKGRRDAGEKIPESITVFEYQETKIK